MVDQEQASGVEPLIERVWGRATEALAASLRFDGNQTAQQVMQAVVRQVVREAHNDEILAIIRQMLSFKERGFFAAAPQARNLVDLSPFEAICDFVESVLMATMMRTATSFSGDGASLIKTETLGDSVPGFERELLRLILQRWPALFDELGERVRDLLAYHYGVISPVSQGAIELDEADDKAKLRVAFERLLWACYLTDGFVRPTTKWMGKPVEAGEILTSTRQYLQRSVREEFLRHIMQDEPDMLACLGGNQLAGLSTKYPFMGTSEEKMGRWESEVIARRSFLPLLWEYYKRHRLEFVSG